MKKRTFDIAENAEDLENLGVGSIILTVYRAILELDVIEEGRKDSGTRYWIEPGTLRPMAPHTAWFPAVIVSKRSPDSVQKKPKRA